MTPSANLDRSRTPFPELSISEFLSDDDDDTASQNSGSKYRTKEDQDVAVFMKIAELLSIDQLTHLLQGNARAKLNLPPLPPPPSSSSPTNLTTTTDEKESSDMKRRLTKKFRWADIAGGTSVRCVIHEIESLVPLAKDLWWTDEEMSRIRKRAIDTVKFFRKNRPIYIQAVDAVGLGRETNTSTIEKHLKQLIQDSFARGLEVHIVPALQQVRAEIVASVLEEQNECRNCHDSYDLTCESLCGQSLAYSSQSRAWAAHLASCDHIDALKASVSVWTAELEIIHNTKSKSNKDNHRIDTVQQPLQPESKKLNKNYDTTGSTSNTTDIKDGEVNSPNK